MRDEFGYACVAFDGQCYALFGVGDRDVEAVNLEGNGLALFPEIHEARRARLKLRSRYLWVGMMKLHLWIAVTAADLPLLHRKRSLVVIQGEQTSDDQLIFGPFVPGTIRAFDSAARYCENGFTPFRFFRDAERCAGEIVRQAGTPAHPALIQRQWL